MATRLYSNARECPVDPCPRTVRPGHLMCAVHWRQIPKPIQLQVWRTWRAFEKAMTDETWAAYETARAEALDWFASHQP